MFANSNNNVKRIFIKSTKKTRNFFTMRRLKPAATKIEYFRQSERPHQHRYYNCSCLIYQALVRSMVL